MAEATDASEPQPGRMTREGLLRKAGAGAVALGVLGPAKYAFAGPMKYKHKQLKGDLKILQWAHFVPAYDVWFDGTWTKQWGENNDVQVSVDHINNALLYTTATSQVAAQSGHDLFQFLSPPSSFQKQVVPVTDLVQEVTKKLGKMTDVARRSTYNPRTKSFFGFPDNYVPDPVHFRHSLWNDVGLGPSTWENVLKAAPKLKAAGHPVGLGMSNELDSNMFLRSLMYCFGGAEQTADGKPNLNSKGNVEALKYMRSLFKTGMTDEVFAWTTASNNQGFQAGRLSMALNAISIARALELANSPISDDTWIWPIPGGPGGRLGNEHVMGVYVIWKFAKNKPAAKQYLVDQQLAYVQHFNHSGFYNFPAWNGAIKGGFKGIHKLCALDKHKPRGKYTILATIAEKYTTNPGHPGYANAVVDEAFNTFLIPQMFAQVAQDKMTAQSAAKAMQGKYTGLFRKWRAQNLV
jgi:multiple sugar transport system substrate-binding protein